MTVMIGAVWTEVGITVVTCEEEVTILPDEEKVLYVVERTFVEYCVIATELTGAEACTTELFIIGRLFGVDSEVLTGAEESIASGLTNVFRVKTWLETLVLPGHAAHGTVLTKVESTTCAEDDEEARGVLEALLVIAAADDLWWCKEVCTRPKEELVALVIEFAAVLDTVTTELEDLWCKEVCIRLTGGLTALVAVSLVPEAAFAMAELVEELVAWVAGTPAAEVGFVVAELNEGEVFVVDELITVLTGLLNCDAERLTAISTLVVGCALAEVDVLDVVHGTVVTIVFPSTTVVFVVNDGTGIVDDGTIAVIGFVDKDIPGTVVSLEDVVTGMLAFVVEVRPVTEDFKESEVAGVEDSVTSDEARTLALVVG
ncbi:MAG: hypothetical protein Q9164_005379 [Protoblastenia rupestris]